MEWCLTSIGLPCEMVNMVFDINRMPCEMVNRMVLDINRIAMRDG